MERTYKAFISYRHLPLEKATARKLHRTIERYIIPRELRKNGEKKLGLVFRDQDELPIASNLTENIETALARSEFLIVICSPETVQSEWVRREISLFVQTHDRSHVLAFLVKGTPETAFPPELTDVVSPDGTLIRRIEPLAANIVSDSPLRRKRLFRTESLRILASLIGCPYDALYHREQRFRRRRIIAAGASAAALAAVFIGMLLNRNAQIHSQLLIAQENESIALSRLAAAEYREGNYHQAVACAAEALPLYPGQRPYVAEAEMELGRILAPYQGEELAFDQSFGQASDIQQVLLSRGGDRAFVSDSYGSVRCYDARSGLVLWQQALPSGGAMTGIRLREVSSLNALLAWESSGTRMALLRADTGETLWQQTEARLLDLSEEAGRFLSVASLADGSFALTLGGLETGTSLLQIPLGREYGASGVEGGCLSGNGERAAVLFRDPAVLGSAGGTASLVLWDAGAEELRRIDRIPCTFSTASRLLFTPDGRLTAAWDTWGEGGEVRCYLPEQDWAQAWTTPVRTADDYTVFVNEKMLSTGNVDFLLAQGEDLLLGGHFALYRIRLSDGEIRWRKTLPGMIQDLRAGDAGSAVLLLKNGLISSVSADGSLGFHQGKDYFETGLDLSCGSLAGDSWRDVSALVVPFRHPGRVSVVRRRNDAPASPLPGGESLAAYPQWVLSPSGKKLAAARFLSAGMQIAGEVWDLRQEKRLSSFTVPTESMRLGFGFQLTEDGRLIIGGEVLDPESQSLRPLTPVSPESGDLRSLQAVSAADPAGGRILTGELLSRGDDLVLSLWENGTVPLADSVPLSGEEQITDANLLSLSAGGCALVSCASQEGKVRFRLYSLSAGRWTDLPDLADTVYAQGGPKNLLAVQRKNGALECLDGNSGAVLWSGTSPLPAASVTKMVFAGGDAYLLLLSDAGTLAVLDAENGSCLHVSADSQGIPFRSDARVDAVVNQNRDQMIIGYHDAGEEQDLLMQISLSSWSQAGAWQDAACYLPSLDRILIRNRASGSVWTAPLLHTEDLLRMARTFLDRGLSPQE